MNYQKIDEEFQLMDDDTLDIILTAKEIAIVFDKSCGTLLKHGPVDNVENWLQNARKKYYEAGLSDIAADLTMVSSSNWDLEELNKILNICDYVKLFYQRNFNANYLA